MQISEIDRYIDAEMGDMPVACRKGCSFCCHQLVVLTCRDDGQQILAAARERMDAGELAVFEARVRDQATAIANIGHEAAETGRWPCPLLRNNACVVYDMRPVACRSVFSPDADTCKAMMEANDFEDLTPLQQAVATEIGERAFRLQVAINDRRPVDGPRELRQLLVELLDEELADDREAPE